MVFVRQELILFDSGNKFLIPEYPVFVDAPCVGKVNSLWSNINKLIYLKTRPNFQATRIVVECYLNMKVERIGYKWSEFDNRCESESCLSAPYSVTKYEI